MIHRSTRIAAAAATLCAAFAAPALAGDATPTDVSRLAPPSQAAVAPACTNGDDASATTPAPGVQRASLLAWWPSRVDEPPQVEVNGVHYRPRSGGWGRHTYAQGVTQFHLGFYDPNGTRGAQFLAGLRGGPEISPNVQVGVGVDWAHKTENVSTVTSTETGPGGVPITVQHDISRATSDLIPIVAYIQFSADENLAVIPFFGASGGWELLSLSGDDFTNGTHFDATFGGWGWQVWGGLALPMSGRTRLTGEAFVNGGDVSRDVNDPFTGETLRETVNVDGVGARAGIAWGF